MKPSQIALALESCIAARVPAIVEGPPGIGKTYVARELAARLNRKFHHIYAATLDPVDLIGVPYVDDYVSVGFVEVPVGMPFDKVKMPQSQKVTRWAAPGLLPQEPGGIVFIDEISSVEPAMQKALFSLIQFGMAGDYRAPENTYIFGAGNNETDRAGVTRMLTPLKSRLVHLPMEADHDDWINWALANNLPMEIIGFIKFKPSMLHQFDPNAPTFPCPRTWELAAKLIDTGLPPSVEMDVLGGTVGKGAAIELVAFLKIYRELPNVDQILMTPKTAPVPPGVDTRYALSAALAHRSTKDNFEAVVTYMDRMPKEYQVLAVTMATRRDNRIPMTRAFTAWAAKNVDVVS